jgi:hypothetical protein
VSARTMSRSDGAIAITSTGARGQSDRGTSRPCGCGRDDAVRTAHLMRPQPSRDRTRTRRGHKQIRNVTRRGPFPAIGAQLCRRHRASGVADWRLRARRELCRSRHMVGTTGRYAVPGGTTTSMSPVSVS